MRGRQRDSSGAADKQAISTGQLTAMINWPSDLSPRDRHLAFQKTSLTFKSQ
ncbi:MAG: hypothetical protein R6V19_01835 [Armatimonadota bacterium]